MLTLLKRNWSFAWDNGSRIPKVKVYTLTATPYGNENLFKKIELKLRMSLNFHVQNYIISISPGSAYECQGNRGLR